MRNKAGLALVASLLFIGAGCAAGVTQQADVNADIKPHEEGMMPAEKLNADVDVDAEVDGILKSADDEKSAALDTEADASEVGTDGSDVDAMINASYAD